MEDTVCLEPATEELDIGSFVKYKRVSSSQLERDAARAEEWRSKTQEDINMPKDITHSVAKPKPSAVPRTPVNQTNVVPCMATTRSKTKMNVSAKPFTPPLGPSPIPQVDGSADQPANQIQAPRISRYDCDLDGLQGWQRALLQAADRCVGAEGSDG